MFACIYGRTLSERGYDAAALLVDLAFTFSPLVEQTRTDTVVLDVSGQELLFGSPVGPSRTLGARSEIDWVRSIANEITRRATLSDLKVNVSIAANPDVAIHAARSFQGVAVIPAGEELTKLGSLPLQLLDYSLAGIEKEKAEEIRETLGLWGVHTFSDFAKLPVAGVAQRLGQEGVSLQKLAQGKSERHLYLFQPAVGFEQALELEHPVVELESLSFIFARLLNQLCAHLNSHALATNELRLHLKLEDKTEYERALTLPVPMRNPKTFLRLLLMDIESKPPQAAIIAVMIKAEPVQPRELQTGLFIPLAPESEKLELTLARLAKLVGPDNVGSVEVLDTHRPDAFRLTRFRLNHRTRKNVGKNSRIAVNVGMPALPASGFRVFRPPWRAEVQTIHERPTRINACGAPYVIRGQVVCASGPWRTSGDWWRADLWARDEWDVAVSSSGSPQDDVLCRIYRDLQSEEWFVEGVYD
jgi:protein ImuB